jgi:hypothetical protein
VGTEKNIRYHATAGYDGVFHYAMKVIEFAGGDEFASKCRLIGDDYRCEPA